MISYDEAQEMHRIIGQSMVSGDTAGLERALELASVIVSDLEPEEPEERVVFRKFPHNGEVIALFPDQYNPTTGNIGSYMHNGQHADTAPDVGDTKPADYADYADLFAELVRQGYTNLKVVKRITIRPEHRERAR